MTTVPDPLARPELTEAEKTAQRETRDYLAQTATLAVDGFCVRNRDALSAVTEASRTRLIVDAAIGYLLAEGLIQATDPEPDPDRWLALDLPPHLEPDVASALREYRRVQGALPR